MGNSDSPQRIDGLTGVVVRALWRRQQERARGGVVGHGRPPLRAEAQRWAYLRRPELDKYVGKRVKCDGFIVGYMLLAERLVVLSR